MALLPIPKHVLDTGDTEYINTWRTILRQLSGSGTTSATLQNTFNANTILKADTDNTPVALTVGAGTIVGRTSSGSIAALTASQIRTVAGLGALATGDTGSDVPVSGFSGVLNGDTDVQSAFDTIDGLSLGGLVREDTATADGTSESLQVTATTTPSTIKRMLVHYRSIKTEIDSEALGFTFIDSTDTEITGTVYYYEGFSKTNGSSVADTSGAATTVTIGTIGNDTNEYFNIKLDLLSQNGSNTQKDFLYQNTYRLATGELRVFYLVMAVVTSNPIKGVRLDTNNAGDMLNSGTAEMWVQV